jgi:hypothetical protein
VPLHRAVLAEALRLRSGKSEIADVSSGEVLALADFGFAVDGMAMAIDTAGDLLALMKS